jgi:hypothetical protein
VIKYLGRDRPNSVRSGTDMRLVFFRIEIYIRMRLRMTEELSGQNSLVMHIGFAFIASPSL